MGRKARGTERKTERHKVGKGSWGQTMKYLNAVLILSYSVESTILGFSRKVMSLDTCLGKSNLGGYG